MLPVCFHVHQVPSAKVSIRKGSKLLPLEQICFPFRINPFSEGSRKSLDLVISLENVSVPLKGGIRFVAHIRLPSLYLFFMSIMGL